MLSLLLSGNPAPLWALTIRARHFIPESSFSDPSHSSTLAGSLGAVEGLPRFSSGSISKVEFSQNQTNSIVPLS